MNMRKLRQPEDEWLQYGKNFGFLCRFWDRNGDLRGVSKWGLGFINKVQLLGKYFFYIF